MEEIMAKAAKYAKPDSERQAITLNRDKPVQHSAKDAASLGSEALAAGNFPLAITHYTKAISTHPQAVDYYIKRSTAYTRVSPSQPTQALSDAETAVVLAHSRGKRELIAQAQLRRGIVSFALERYGEAAQCFEWVRKLTPKESSLSIWDVKVKDKLDGLKPGDKRAEFVAKELPDVDITKLGKESTKASTLTANTTTSSEERHGSMGDKVGAAEQKFQGVQTPASKIRHDWYQTTETVTITLLAKGVPKDKATVEIEPQALAISFPLPTGSDFEFSLDPLFAVVDPTASTYKIMSTKVEFILKKATPGQKWHSLESATPITSAQNGSTTTTVDPIKRAVFNSNVVATAPAYPTSSRSGPKNWDKLANDLTKRPTKKEESAKADETTSTSEAVDESWVDDDDGGDPAQAFFQKIFKDAEPDTKRAMMKSYQESNGTALSTNWAEVGKGKVETSPPDGMVAKKWGE